MNSSDSGRESLDINNLSVIADRGHLFVPDDSGDDLQVVLVYLNKATSESNRGSRSMCQRMCLGCILTRSKVRASRSAPYLCLEL